MMCLEEGGWGGRGEAPPGFWGTLGEENVWSCQPSLCRVNRPGCGEAACASAASKNFVFQQFLIVSLEICKCVKMTSLSPCGGISPALQGTRVAGTAET